MKPDLAAWAIEWRSQNKLDGETRHIVWQHVPGLGQCDFRLFPTRKRCKEFIESMYSYIRRRPDLRREPHGLRMPRPVRVSVTRMRKRKGEA
jgi:hypothetical protein